MGNTAEMKLLEEVALRKAVSRFRRINKASRKKAITPEVGIFWIDNSGEMFAAGVSVLEGEDYGDFKTFAGSHVGLWDAVIRANPKWRGLEYEEVPRGRVVYKRDPKKPEFIVYMPERIRKYQNKVISRFKLPLGYIRVDFSDEHYQL